MNFQDKIKYFAKIDLRKAYYQLVLASKSREKTAINTPFGLYMFNRLPFGIKTVPVLFQRYIEKITRDFKNIKCYLDDLLVYGRSETEFISSLNNLLNRLELNGLKLQKSKCVFLTQELSWLGHNISCNGIQLDEKKVIAITNMNIPESNEDLKRFLGLTNFYLKFISDYNKKVGCLYELLKNDSLFEIKEHHRLAISKLKKELCSNPVLEFFNPSVGELILRCDASFTALGCVLEQKQPEGDYKPICYYSRKFTNQECKYAIGEKEALVIVDGILKFRLYLLGKPFVVETDHITLATLMNESENKIKYSRIMRWRMKLNEFNFTVIYKKGYLNIVPDVLSRLAQTEKESVIVAACENVDSEDTIRNLLISALKKINPFY